MPITALSKAPGPGFYIDGMKLGDGIDAITGDISQSALDSTFTVSDVTTTQAGDTWYFRMVSDVTELENSSALGLSSSLTFPADGMNITAKNTLDFTHSNKSSSSTVLIVFDWERRGDAEQVAQAKLNADAQACLAQDKATFRDKFGDYYISQITRKTKFTAIWKCTSTKLSDVSAFKQEISGSINAGEMEAGGNFTTALNNAARTHNVTVEVQYQVIGNAGDTRYDMGDVRETFNSFRTVAKPIPYEILLKHYSVINHRVPNQIAMDPDVFRRVCDVYGTARFLLFMNGVIPGTRAVRLERRNQLEKLFKEIHAKRLAFEHDQNALADAIEKLQQLHATIWVRIQRQDLVSSQLALSYDELKSKFHVDHENDHEGGCAWIPAATNERSYALGRTSFSADEVKKYAIESIMVAEVRRTGTFLDQEVAALEFPGTSGVNGYVVGLVVESCWKDGTNGWWGILKNLSLGTKQAKVKVKTKGSRGMHWRLTAYYIPSLEYDE